MDFLSEAVHDKV